ncbi:hypothetical protein LMG19089_03741 [Ralstonia edaphis]|nr:hypothetical protein LMG19089_03741 [Ralstonia sp. LMG 6871]
MAARAGSQSNHQWASSFSFRNQARARGLKVLTLSTGKYGSCDLQLRTGGISIEQWLCYSSTSTPMDTMESLSS